MTITEFNSKYGDVFTKTRLKTLDLSNLDNFREDIKGIINRIMNSGSQTQEESETSVEKTVINEDPVKVKTSRKKTKKGASENASSENK